MEHKRSWFELWSAPLRGSCQVCGRSTGKAPWQVAEHHLHRWQQRLCRACIASIPWITSIGCRSCGRAIRCSDCQRHPLAAHGLSANRGAVRYDVTMKEWLSRFKYKGEQAFGSLFAGMMMVRYESLWQGIDGCQRGATPSQLPDLITYVPSSDVRLYTRGFNQAAIVADALAQAWKRPFLHLLLRIREDERQSHQSRGGRERSMQGAYHWNKGANLCKQTVQRYGKEDEVRIMLIDDVYTTGNTLRACSVALRDGLKEHGIKGTIYGYTWARS